MVVTCDFCGVILDTKTNRARTEDGYWSPMCKTCYTTRFMPVIRAARMKKLEEETGVGF